MSNTDTLSLAVKGIIEDIVKDSCTLGEIKDKVLSTVDDEVKKKYGILPEVIRIQTDDKPIKQVIGTFHEAFNTILQLVKLDIPILLVGPAGSGKNIACKQVAEALELPFYFTNAVQQEHRITGFIDAGGKYHETQFYKAFKDGGLFFLDELDASIPEVLVLLNAAIANRYFDFPTGRVEAHKDFRLIAAGNTFGTGADSQYTGRYNLDAASLDRFSVIPMNYSKKIEESIVNGDEELLAFCHEFRKITNNATISCIFSYRALQAIKKLTDDGMPIKPALKIALIKGLDKDDLNIIKTNLKKVIPANKYVKAIDSM